MPRSCEQFGRFSDVPTRRDAGGTVSVCVATRARFALAVSRALVLLAAFGVFGATVCWGIVLEAGVGVDAGGEVFAGDGTGVDGGADVFDGDGDVFDGDGTGVDGGGDVSAGAGVDAEGGGDVFG